jgi:hypothetical protein
MQITHLKSGKILRFLTHSNHLTTYGRHAIFGHINHMTTSGRNATVLSVLLGDLNLIAESTE